MIPDVREYHLPASFFAANRQKLLDRLPDHAIAVIFAGKAVLMSADSEYRFFANRNFYYLAGIEQEESVLVISKKGTRVRTLLFIQPDDALKERWTGKRLGREETRDLSGISDIMYLPALEDCLQPYLSDRFLPVAIEEGITHGPAKSFEKSIISIHKGRDVISLGPVLTRFRMIKEPCEVEMIKKAIELTDAAIREIARLICPDITELSLSAAFDYALARRGCLVPAFPSIFAAGANALCLHHMNPTGRAQSGELIQIDVGGRVAGLCADISRVFPADGVFTEQQKMLYAAVRACQEKAFQVIRPGTFISTVNNEVRNTAYMELKNMGVIEADNPAQSDITSYYWHGVSHHMGHDVHDASIREIALEPGMVLTVEPGIYIPQLGIGFRIEDDVLVTKDGCEILSSFVLREWEEICAMTGSRGGD